MRVASPNSRSYPSTTLKSQHTRAIRPAIVAASATAFVAVCVISVWVKANPQSVSAPGIWAYTAGALESGADFVQIPEPGALVSLIGGAALLVGIQRFRRRG